MSHFRFGNARFCSQRPALKTVEIFNEISKQLIVLEMMDSNECRALKFDRISETPNLDSKNLKFMRSALQSAERDLSEKKYSSAWYTVNNVKFWVLLNNYLEKAAKFGTEKNLKRADTEKKSLIVPEISNAPIIDGKIDEEVWRKAT